MRGNGGVAVTVSHLDGVEGLGQGADLVNLDEDGVTSAHLDTLLKVLGVGNEKVVTYKLALATDSGGKLNPAFPVFLAEAVLDGVDRILGDELLKVSDLLLGREFLSLWILGHTGLELLVVIEELVALFEAEL